MQKLSASTVRLPDVADTAHAAVREPAQRDGKGSTASSTLTGHTSNTGPGSGDPRLTDEDRAALLALIDGDDLASYLDEVCGDVPDLAG